MYVSNGNRVRTTYIHRYRYLHFSPQKHQLSSYLIRFLTMLDVAWSNQAHRYLRGILFNLRSPTLFMCPITLYTQVIIVTYTNKYRNNSYLSKGLIGLTEYAPDDTCLFSSHLTLNNSSSLSFVFISNIFILKSPWKGKQCRMHNKATASIRQFTVGITSKYSYTYTYLLPGKKVPEKFILQ